MYSSSFAILARKSAGCSCLLRSVVGRVVSARRVGVPASDRTEPAVSCYGNMGRFYTVRTESVGTPLDGARLE